MRFSIVMACYNSVDTISGSISSLLKQDFTDFELLIIDGGSVDGTIEVVKSFVDPRIFLVSEADAGLYDALNKGIILARGDFIGILHSDDVYASSDVLSLVFDAFESNRSVDLVYGDLKYVSADLRDVLRYWRSSNFSNFKLLFGWMPPHPTLFFKKDIFELLGGFDCNYSISADYDLVLRWFFKSGVSAVYVAEVFTLMRVGGVSNRSIRALVTKMAEDLTIVYRNRLLFPFGFLVVFFKNISKVFQFFRK